RDSHETTPQAANSDSRPAGGRRQLEILKCDRPRPRAEPDNESVAVVAARAEHVEIQRDRLEPDPTPESGGIEPKHTDAGLPAGAAKTSSSDLDRRRRWFEDQVR